MFVWADNSLYWQERLHRLLISHWPNWWVAVVVIPFSCCYCNLQDILVVRMQY